MNVDYRGGRATIMGLGHFGGGATAARWLARQGAIVTVTDLADEKVLADSLALLADVPIAALHLGGHREDDFRGAELVVVNPAVRPDSPGLHFARQCGARLVTELELFMENCQARIIGVTGSNGKSTTAAMIASILQAAGQNSSPRRAPTEGWSEEGQGVRAAPPESRQSGSLPSTRPHPNPLPKGEGTKQKTFLGGNLGGSLLERLPEIGRDDWVVLEISSFQLWHFTPTARMPQVAVVTGCSPNHLDWHASYADYMAAKQRILTGQTPEDFAVLNMLDGEVASWSPFGSRPPDFVARRGTLAALAGAGPAQPGQCGLCSGGCRGRRLRVCDHSAGLGAVSPAAAAIAVVCGGRGPAFLQRFGGHHARVDHRRPAVAGNAGLAAGRWEGQRGRFRALGGRNCPSRRGAAFFGSVRHELCNCVAAQRPQFPCVAVETLDEALRLVLAAFSAG